MLLTVRTCMYMYVLVSVWVNALESYQLPYTFPNYGLRVFVLLFSSCFQKCWQKHYEFLLFIVVFIWFQKRKRIVTAWAMKPVWFLMAATLMFWRPLHQRSLQASTLRTSAAPLASPCLHPRSHRSSAFVFLVQTVFTFCTSLCPLTLYVPPALNFEGLLVLLIDLSFSNTSVSTCGPLPLNFCCSSLRCQAAAWLLAVVWHTITSYRSSDDPL